jgi:hypothetical protein
MELPKTITEALEALKGAQEVNATLSADLQAANELLAEAQAANAQLSEVSGRNAELLAEKIVLEQKLSELTQSVQAQEMRVTEVVASLGVPPVAIAPEPVQQRSKADLWAEYQKLPVEARNAFYKANRDLMRD